MGVPSWHSAHSNSEEASLTPHNLWPSPVTQPLCTLKTASKRLPLIHKGFGHFLLSWNWPVVCNMLSGENEVINAKWNLTQYHLPYCDVYSPLEYDFHFQILLFTTRPDFVRILKDSVANACKNLPHPVLQRAEEIDELSFSQREKCLGK